MRISYPRRAFRTANLLLAMVCAGCLQLLAIEECKLPDLEKPVAIFQQVDGKPWFRVANPKADLAGDVISTASVFKSPALTRVTISTWVAGDIDDLALYCFDTDGRIQKLTFRADTAWGWSYEKTIVYGRPQRSNEKFFDSNSERPLKKSEQENWIKEHVEEFHHFKDMPFFSLLNAPN